MDEIGATDEDWQRFDGAIQLALDQPHGRFYEASQEAKEIVDRTQRPPDADPIMGAKARAHYARQTDEAAGNLDRKIRELEQSPPREQKLRLIEAEQYVRVLHSLGVDAMESAFPPEKLSVDHPQWREAMKAERQRIGLN